MRRSSHQTKSRRLDASELTTSCAHRVIYNPFLEKLYSAQKGKGAWLNQTTRLPLSHPNAAPLASLGDAVIGVEWGSDRSKEVIEKKGRMYMRLAGDPKEVEGGVMAHSLRSIGCAVPCLRTQERRSTDELLTLCLCWTRSSAALHYAYVAAGQLDLYFEIGCWSWDVCAGIIIAREAGGKVYGTAIGPIPSLSHSVLAET